MADFLARTVNHILLDSTAAPPLRRLPELDVVGFFSITYADPALALDRLVIKSGGTWPPSPTFDSSWPPPLRVYHTAYEIFAPFFPVLQSSVCDTENRCTIDAMRARIRGLLSEDPALHAYGCSVDMPSVVNILTAAQVGCWTGYDDQTMQSAILGFCACVSFLRLAYRWGVSPVVREAQMETSVSFPPELDEPWLLLQRFLGFTSPGGGLSTCLYFNTRGVDTNFKPFYSSVHGLPHLHQKTADWDARLFLESLPMYRLLASTVSACTSFTREHPLTALTSLKEANTIFQSTSRFFFENMKDANISHTLWLAYLQGYTGWALPGPDGNIISGVSGGQSLTIRTLDAFLGIRPFPQPAEEALYLPLAQRDWLQSLREACFNIVATSAGAPDNISTDFWLEMQNELQKMVQQLRLWRMGHMNCMVPYEAVHRPERVFMTAGLSIPPEGEVSDETGMVEHLKEGLRERLKATI
ncbi:hypothetical protein B0H17DRAFT_934786 [Mycena rosella]|uniref:Uncharacterized protein n=1 Tax=Mycena rosella TaxID=1033263 RepID=A0AAD7DJL7_MYCRO|nr:hypothetical protein B0H17DRAFT_934786 [Mycena rosella]